MKNIFEMSEWLNDTVYDTPIENKSDIKFMKKQVVKIMDRLTKNNQNATAHDLTHLFESMAEEYFEIQPKCAVAVGTEFSLLADSFAQWQARPYRGYYKVIEIDDSDDKDKYYLCKRLEDNLFITIHQDVLDDIISNRAFRDFIYECFGGKYICLSY